MMGIPKPPFRAFFMRLPAEKAAQIRETVKRAGNAIYQLGETLEDNFSEQAVDEAIQAMNEAAEKIEQVTKKITNNKGEINESK